jgi:DNA-binding SARP family transcriptional activator
MPVIAILTFGRFTLCQQEQEIAPPGRQGDTLCKALLCQPGRQAESAWLLEHLWPEAEGDLAITYLHNAAWTLRQTLPAGMLLTHKATQSYQLVGQDQLWVDADAALARIAEADAVGITTMEALPRLEQAVHYFQRGRFLAGVEETWVQARRMHLEMMKERALLGLAEMYRQHGKHTQAATLLSEALAEDPANENVLCHLMQTLHEEGMTHQALRAYEEFAKSLKKAGLEPAEMTTALYRRLKRAPRGLALSALSTTAPSSLPSSSLADPQQENASQARDTTEPRLISVGSQDALTRLLPLFSSAVTRGILQAAGELERGSEGDKNIQQKSNEHGPQQTLLLSSWSGVDVPFDPFRRSFNIQFFQFLCSLTGAAAASFIDPEVWDRLLASAAHPSALHQSSIDAFQDLIEVCWQLCNSGKIDVAEHLLLLLLPSLQHVADRQLDAARLTAECFRLLSVLSAHQLKLADKLTQCWQSVHYARLAREPNTLAACLHELTAALRYTGQPDRLFLAFQEALSFCEQLEPPLRAGIYAGAAAAFAQRQRRKEADFYIHLAYEVAQESSTRNLALADNSLAHLAEYEGLLFLELGQPRQAYETFDRFTRQAPQNGLPERNRLEMLNYQGLAALRLLDLDRYVSCLERGIEGALAIDSKKRLQEAFTIFQQIPAHWRDEPRMRQVMERFHLPMGGVN